MFHSWWQFPVLNPSIGDLVVGLAFLFLITANIYVGRRFFEIYVFALYQVSDN